LQRLNEGREKRVVQKKPIGKILVQEKKIDQKQLGKALERQRQDGGKLVSNLLEMGVAGEQELLASLGAQLGVPAVDFSLTIVPLRILDLVPESVAVSAHILPLYVDSDRIFLAMADPEDQQVTDEVTFITGRRVEPYVALEARINMVVREAYALHKRDPSALYFRGEQAAFPEGKEDPNGYIAVITQQLPDPDVNILSDDELITIEISDQDEVESENPVAPKASSDDRKCILVVDDEEEIIRMLTKVFSKEGFRVVSAMKGLEALQAVKTHSPNLILLDAMLPEIHGFEICKKIKASKRFGSIPVVMISAVYKGWRYAQDVKEAYGADDYFEKPFRIVPLVRRVRDLLRAGPANVEEELDPNEATRFYRQGVEYYRGKQYDEADRSLREATRLDPFNAMIHYALANVLLTKNMLYEAMREYESAVELKPNLFAPLRNLAILYQKKGFKNKAVEMWERALRCSPDESTQKQVREQLLKLL
jgi:DNA-binding response OmpR family regulator